MVWGPHFVKLNGVVAMARKAKTKKSKKQKQPKTHRKSDPPMSLETHGSLLKRALEWFVTGLDQEKVKRHGNVRWSAVSLIFMAVLWSWSDRSGLVAGFEDAKTFATQLFGDLEIASYQVMVNALKRYSAELIPLVCCQMQRLMQSVGGKHYRIGKFIPLAVDGTRVSTPQTEVNEKTLCAPNYGKGSTAKSRKKWKNKTKRTKQVVKNVKPQIWLTMIWHIGTRLGWCWKLGASNSSERHHLIDMLMQQVFPENTLFCFDAGFVGYELWSTILGKQHHFVARVGGNVRLLKGLTNGGRSRKLSKTLHLWPDSAINAGLPPIELRVIKLHGPRGVIYLVTSILSKAELSDQQACELYKLRWGIEVQFRTLKQTFRRSMLRCRTPEAAMAELEWSLVGLTLIQLFAIKEQIKIDIAPSRSSAALAIRVIQNAMRCGPQAVHDPEELNRRLAAAVKDDYVRLKTKQGRYKTPYNDKPSATKPKIINATPQKIKAYAATEAKS